MSDEMAPPDPGTGHTQPSEDVGLLALVRFIAELGMLAALGYGGWHLLDAGALSVVLALALPLAAAMVWGRWIAPRAERRLSDPTRLVAELVLLSSAAGVLALAVPNPLTTMLAAGLVLMFLISLPHRRTEVANRQPRH